MNFKSRGVTIAFALILGGLGVHKFYLGKILSGVLYLILSFTFLPMILAICDGMYYIIIGENKFNKKYTTQFIHNTRLHESTQRV